MLAAIVTELVRALNHDTVVLAVLCRLVRQLHFRSVQLLLKLLGSVLLQLLLQIVAVFITFVQVR